jgi:hypothetical protein
MVVRADKRDPYRKNGLKETLQSQNETTEEPNLIRKRS